MVGMMKPQFNRAGKQFRMWMPIFPLMLVGARNRTPRHPLYLIFRTVPKATKHEIKEYLTKIYNLPVRKVNTMNYDGARKRVYGSRGIAYYKYANFKKAVVYMDEDKMSSVGIGTKIPELDGVKWPDSKEEAMDANKPDQKQIS